MWKDFKAFVLKGNVLDLAIAVVLGGAFGAIVTSLVNDIIMPLVGIILGGIDFAALSIQVGSATVLYGKFIQAIVNFLIIAFVIFLVMRCDGQAEEARGGCASARSHGRSDAADRDSRPAQSEVRSPHHKKPRTAQSMNRRTGKPVRRLALVNGTERIGDSESDHDLGFPSTGVEASAGLTG